MGFGIFAKKYALHFLAKTLPRRIPRRGNLVTNIGLLQQNPLFLKNNLQANIQ
jgi:hypothetical protein